MAFLYTGRRRTTEAAKLYQRGDLSGGPLRHLRTNAAFVAVSIASILLSGGVLFGYLSTAPSAPAMRLGFFPNIIHSQALYGIATGEYEKALQRVSYAMQPQVFNAGPAAIQALLSNHVDVVFVGPSPTLSGLAAAPNDLRVIAGASSGGAMFVAQPDIRLVNNSDFGGRKFATPQWGNTQDIALKYYLWNKTGHRTLDEGGDVDVINAANPEILTLFKLRHIDGAWVPEPWATRLIQEANAKVILDERDLWPRGQFVSTQILTTRRYLEDAAHQAVLTAFLRAYVNVTLHLQKAKPADLQVIGDEIYNLTATRLDRTTILAPAFRNFDVTYDPIAPSLATYLSWAQALDFLAQTLHPDTLYDLTLLNQVLNEMGLPPVKGL